MKKVNIALIGSGFMGKEHSKAYALAPVIFPDIAAVPVRKVICDVNEELAKSAAEKFGFEEYTADFDAIIKRSDIDIVDICYPPHLHADMAIKCMEAGKFVFCEKPLVTTKEEAVKLVAAIKRTNGRTAVALNKRRWPAVIFAKKLLEEGMIGKPLFYSGQYLQGAGIMRDMFWGFRNSRLQGGGFADSTSHIIDMGRFILGDNFDEVIGVSDIYSTESIARPLKPGESVDDVPKVPRDAEDTVSFMAKMKSGVLARFFWTCVCSGAGEGIGFEIIGEKGTISWSGQHPSELYVSEEAGRKDARGVKTILMGPQHPYGQAVPPLPGFGVGVDDNMAFQAYEVINACANNTKYTPDFIEASQIVLICDAIRESIDKKAWVKVQDIK